MRELDRSISRRGRAIVTRSEVLAAGGSDRVIASRVAKGVWSRPQAGVYVWGPDPTGWLERLAVAVAAAGPAAAVSHRSAFVLWGLEGLTTSLVELTVPYECKPIPGGVILHRTRRTMPTTVRRGLAVTSVERTLLDAAAVVPGMVLAKGVDYALRHGMTSPERLWEMAITQGGRGVPNAGLYRTIVADLTETGSTGSPAEKEALQAMRRAGVPEPILQWEVVAPSGNRYLVDFGWPDLNKGVEIDGYDAHSGQNALDRDLARQNDLLTAGIELRRFSARTVRRFPSEVAHEVKQFLL